MCPIPPCSYYHPLFLSESLSIYVHFLFVLLLYL